MALDTAIRARWWRALAHLSSLSLSLLHLYIIQRLNQTLALLGL
jgi:hypothetical protein